MGRIPLEVGRVGSRWRRPSARWAGRSTFAAALMLLLLAQLSLLLEVDRVDGVLVGAIAGVSDRVGPLGRVWYGGMVELVLLAPGTGLVATGRSRRDTGWHSAPSGGRRHEVLPLALPLVGNCALSLRFRGATVLLLHHGGNCSRVVGRVLTAHAGEARGPTGLRY